MTDQPAVAATFACGCFVLASALAVSPIFVNLCIILHSGRGEVITAEAKKEN